MRLKPTSLQFEYEPFTKNDLKTLYSLTADSHIREFLMEGQEFSKGECSELISNSEILFDQVGLGLYFIYHQGGVIGYCGFMATRPPSNDLDVVYAFTNVNTGYGYATEACRALVELIRKSSFTGHLTAVVHPLNIASKKVLGKNNFYKTGFALGELNHLLRYRLIS